MGSSFNPSHGPQFTGNSIGHELRTWVWRERMPYLIKELGLPAGDALSAINFLENNIFVSPPATGKNMVFIPAALQHYKRIYVLVPSVVQAQRAKDSLDRLYHPLVGGCITSQLVEDDMIKIVTTGIFHQLVRDPGSDIWQDDTLLVVDEFQRIIANDLLTEFWLAYFVLKGGRFNIMSATIDPSNLPAVYPAKVHELKKQMHPIDIEQVHDVNLEQKIKEVMPNWTAGKRTSLIFCPSRARVAQIAGQIRNMYEEGGVGVVTVVGGDDVSTKEAEMNMWVEQGVPLVIVGTPGVLDSSVTIPGLSRIIIDDSRNDVAYNENGVRETYRKRISVNDLWQMIRRCGREKRAEGDNDQVLIITPEDRSEDLAEDVKFAPVTGSSPHTPIEKLLLEAIRLDTSFTDIARHMVTKFSDDHIACTMERLVADGMIADSRLTALGNQVINLPFEYPQAKAVATAPENLQILVSLAFSFGSLYSYRDFEKEFSMEEDSESELLSKIRFGITYWNSRDDIRQLALAEATGMSWRRLETVERIFELALTGLNKNIPNHIDPSLLEEYRLELTQYFIECGLYEFYILDGNGKSWATVLEKGGERRVYFPAKDCKLDFTANPAGQYKICVVVAEETWYTSRAGNGMANLNDVTIVPFEKACEIVEKMANEDGWEVMDFTPGTDPKGKPQMECFRNGKCYIADRFSVQPKEEMQYWVKIGREIASDVVLVNIMYPVF